MLRAEIVDSVDGIEAERIEVKVLQPIQCVFDEEPPYFVAVGTVVVDRLAPGSAIAIGKVRAKCTKVVAFRTKMVVDHVERHCETMSVRCVDQTLQRLRTTI